MRRPAHDQEPRVVASFSKNTMEDVRAVIQTFKGHQLVGLVTYFRPLGSDTAYPTRKGVLIKPELLPELLRAVDALKAALTGEGSHDERP